MTDEETIEDVLPDQMIAVPDEPKKRRGRPKKVQDEPATVEDKVAEIIDSPTVGENEMGFTAEQQDALNVKVRALLELSRQGELSFSGHKRAIVKQLVKDLDAAYVR